jgi:hypothetical protein
MFEQDAGHPRSHCPQSHDSDSQRSSHLHFIRKVNRILISFAGRAASNIALAKSLTLRGRRREELDQWETEAPTGTMFCIAPNRTMKLQGLEGSGRLVFRINEETG